MKINKYYVIKYRHSFEGRDEIVKSIGKKSSKVATYDPIFKDGYGWTYGYKDIVLKNSVTCSETMEEYPLSESKFLTKKEIFTGKISSLRILEIFFLLNKNKVKEETNEDKKQKMLVPEN